MGMIKLKNILDKITLYHGTCPENAKLLLKNGWLPNEGVIGGNYGNTKYLYCTTDIEDARWFANEKGCDTILKIKDVPKEDIIPDPEDASGYTKEEYWNMMLNDSMGMPYKWAIKNRINKNKISIIKK
jgi:hypothetical protein